MKCPNEEDALTPTPVGSQTNGYVAIYTFWEDVTILCCGYDEAMVEKKSYEIAENRKLRNFKANIYVIEVEAT